MTRLRRGAVVLFGDTTATVVSVQLLPAARLQVDLDNGARFRGPGRIVLAQLPTIEAVAA